MLPQDYLTLFADSSSQTTTSDLSEFSIPSFQPVLDYEFLLRDYLFTTEDYIPPSPARTSSPIPPTPPNTPEIIDLTLDDIIDLTADDDDDMLVDMEGSELHPIVILE